jgi:hypothetical protein
MVDKSNSFWKNYTPTIVLLLIVVGFAVWAFTSEMAFQAHIPSVSLAHAILLIIVGLFAGILGELSALVDVV